MSNIKIQKHDELKLLHLGLSNLIIKQQDGKSLTEKQYLQNSDSIFANYNLRKRDTELTWMLKSVCNLGQCW